MQENLGRYNVEANLCGPVAAFCLDWPACGAKLCLNVGKSYCSDCQANFPDSNLTGNFCPGLRPGCGGYRDVAFCFEVGTRTIQVQPRTRQRLVGAGAAEGPLTFSSGCSRPVLSGASLQMRKSHGKSAALLA